MPIYDNQISYEEGQKEMPKIGDIRHDPKQRKQIWAACTDCGAGRWVRIRGNQPVPKLCRRCSCAKVNGPGDVAHNWQGGYRRMASGYVLVWISKDDFFYPMAGSKSYVREHRLVMAKHLGRCLQKWELVHHKNGIRNDNQIDNLEITIRSEHMQVHNKGYRHGYREGFIDGQNTQVRELRKEIRLLRFQIKEGAKV